MNLSGFLVRFVAFCSWCAISLSAPCDGQEPSTRLAGQLDNGVWNLQVRLSEAFLLNSGNVVTGFVTTEKGKEIAVRDSQGKSHRILRDEIEERIRRKTSAMPKDLAGSLTANELADLIAYLKSL